MEESPVAGAKDRKVEDGEQFREHREQVPSIHVKRLDIPRNPEDCVLSHWTGRLMVGCPNSHQQPGQHTPLH